LREARASGFVEPRLIGVPAAIAAVCKKIGWEAGRDWSLILLRETLMNTGVKIVGHGKPPSTKTQAYLPAFRTWTPLEDTV
jgi:hypothetical protein